MNEDNRTPESTPLTTPAADATPITAAPTDETRALARNQDDPFTAPKKSRTRTLLIAGGTVLAAAVLAGGGIAVGAAIADEMDDDDDDRASSASDDRTAGEADTAGSAAAEIGTDSADELSEIIAAASESADGDSVGIEANQDGSWDVTFETSAGEETEVRVAEDGTAEVISTDAADADDSAPLGVLDVDTVDALVAAAMAEVEGSITELEIDDDPASPFDIAVVQANGRTLAIDLDADMKVLSIS